MLAVKILTNRLRKHLFLKPF